MRVIATQNKMSLANDQPIRAVVRKTRLAGEVPLLVCNTIHGVRVDVVSASTSLGILASKAIECGNPSVKCRCVETENVYDTISLDEYLDLFSSEHEKGNPVAKSLAVKRGRLPVGMGSFQAMLSDGKYDRPVPIKKGTRKEQERQHQKVLAQMTGGKMEVQTPVGRVDIVSDQYVIEVKSVENWKGAIGQASVYCQCFPGLKPVVALFGKTSKTELIEHFADQLGVLVWWLD